MGPTPKLQNPGSYNFRKATWYRVSVDPPCLVNVHNFQTLFVTQAFVKDGLLNQRVIFTDFRQFLRSHRSIFRGWVLPSMEYPSSDPHYQHGVKATGQKLSECLETHMRNKWDDEFVGMNWSGRRNVFCEVSSGHSVLELMDLKHEF